MKKNITIFIIMFIGLFIILIPQMQGMDLIWPYGFSYNISQGLIPYKDFNMIIGPIYSLIFSLPMIIFGNYLIVYKIFHILFYSIVLTLCYQKIGKKAFLLIGLYCIQYASFGYNTFIATLAILILFLTDSKKKYSNLIIGLIIGCILMTKHNVGLTLIIVYLITSKNKLKSLFSVLIPVAITLIYLILTKSLYGYINFCYLGMGNFIDNFYYEIHTVIIWTILELYFIKKWIQMKDTKILYILAFTVIIFPLVEFNHFLIALIPAGYYILEKENNRLINRIFYIFLIIGTISVFLQDIKSKELILEDNFLKYNILEKETYNYIKEYSKYTEKIEGNVYIFVYNAYLIKLYQNKTTNFYDLINKGNLGKDEQIYIDKIDKTCKKEKCTFILDEAYFKKKSKKEQISINFKNYVTKNYNYIKKIPSNDRLYTNY